MKSKVVLLTKKSNQCTLGFKLKVFLKIYTRADSNEWRADSIVAHKEDLEKSMIRADSKEGEPTWAECKFWDRPSEPTPMEKSRLEQCQHFWTDWFEPTQSRQSQLEQSEEIYTVHRANSKKKELTRSIRWADSKVFEPTRISLTVQNG